MSSDIVKKSNSPVTVSAKIRDILARDKIVKTWALEADADGNPTNTQVEVFIKLANIDSIIIAATKAAERGDINAAKWLIERAYPKEDLSNLNLNSNIKSFQIDTSLLSPEEYSQLLDFEIRTLGK